MADVSGLNTSGGPGSLPPGGTLPTPPTIEHPLSLKVMRLKRPDFQTLTPILTEKSDQLGQLFNAQVTPHPSLGSSNFSMEGFGLTDTLALPLNFGKIYVGETFSSYISLHNSLPNTQASVRNVYLRVELFTGNNKQTLMDTSSQMIQEFPNNFNKDFIIEQPLSEQGTHILVCTVNYEYKPDSQQNIIESRNFRKIFKFPVSTPLSMRTVKVYTFRESVFVHLELQNTTDGPLYVESVRFDPSPNYELTDHSTHNLGPHYTHAIAKDEVRRFLFELKNKFTSNAPSTTPLSASSIPSSALGKIELIWKTSLGDTGMLVTNAITHKGVLKPDLDLIILDQPEESKFITETPFQLKCRVINRTSDKANVVLKFDTQKMFPISCNGLNMKEIGTIEGNSFVDLTLPLFPLRSGVHTFGNGITIVDTSTNRQLPLTDFSLVHILEHNATK